jgi:hypothetical protein
MPRDPIPRVAANSFPEADHASFFFFGLESRRVGNGSICGRGSGVGSSGGGGSATALFRLSAKPIKPAITSKAPAIISQCGNPNDATAAYLRDGLILHRRTHQRTTHPTPALSGNQSAVAGRLCRA